eukprot:931990-Pyramimonas_sp.AAC.1
MAPRRPEQRTRQSASGQRISEPGYASEDVSGNAGLSTSRANSWNPDSPGPGGCLEVKRVRAFVSHGEHPALLRATPSPAPARHRRWGCCPAAPQASRVHCCLPGNEKPKNNFSRPDQFFFAAPQAPMAPLLFSMPLERGIDVSLLCGFAWDILAAVAALTAPWGNPALPPRPPGADCCPPGFQKPTIFVLPPSLLVVFLFLLLGCAWAAPPIRDGRISKAYGASSKAA